MALRRAYINDAVREWLFDKPIFFWTHKGTWSASDVMQDKESRMQKIAADIIKNRYGEINPEVIIEPDVE